MILFEQGGRKLLAHFDKNGYLSVLDRTDGKLVRAVPFARATWGEIDAATGKVTPRLVPTAQGERICPGPAGAKEWPHAAYGRQTGLLNRPSSKIDPATGKEVWSHRTRFPVLASALATAGGLVFYGEPTGELVAGDAGRPGDPRLRSIVANELGARRGSHRSRRLRLSRGATVRPTVPAGTAGRTRRYARGRPGTAISRRSVRHGRCSTRGQGRAVRSARGTT